MLFQDLHWPIELNYRSQTVCFGPTETPEDTDAAASADKWLTGYSLKEHGWLEQFPVAVDTFAKSTCSYKPTVKDALEWRRAKLESLDRDGLAHARLSAVWHNNPPKKWACYGFCRGKTLTDFVLPSLSKAKALAFNVPTFDVQIGSMADLLRLQLNENELALQGKRSTTFSDKIRAAFRLKPRKQIDLRRFFGHGVGQAIWLAYQSSRVWRDADILDRILLDFPSKDKRKGDYPANGPIPQSVFGKDHAPTVRKALELAETGDDKAKAKGLSIVLDIAKAKWEGNRANASTVATPTVVDKEGWIDVQTEFKSDSLIGQVAGAALRGDVAALIDAMPGLASVETYDATSVVGKVLECNRLGTVAALVADMPWLAADIDVVNAKAKDAKAKAKATPKATPKAKAKANA